MHFFFFLLMVLISLGLAVTPPQEQQVEDQEIQDMRTLYGGSLGGAGNPESEAQQQEDPDGVIEGRSLQKGPYPVDCEEERC